MNMIELPILRASNCIAVTLECAEVAGASVWVATVRESIGRPPRRRWFHEPAPALSYAAEQAERHGLMLFDLREPGD